MLESLLLNRLSIFHELNSFLTSERMELCTLFASDFSSNGSKYRREELEVLRALPIYKMVTGPYIQLRSQDLCMIPSGSFLKPCDERCLSYPTDSVESSLFRALVVPELQDQQILVKLGSPGFEGKPQAEQEDILIYLYMNWQDLQVDSSVVEVFEGD